MGGKVATRLRFRVKRRGSVVNRKRRVWGERKERENSSRGEELLLGKGEEGRDEIVLMLEEIR